MSGSQGNENGGKELLRGGSDGYWWHVVVSSWDSASEALLLFSTFISSIDTLLDIELEIENRRAVRNSCGVPCHNRDYGISPY